MTEMLVFNGIVKAFHQVPVLHGIDLVIHSGEKHALIGPNGAGKTTLFHLAGGQLRPDAGSIHLAGQDLTRMKPQKRAAAGMGRSFQIVQGFAGLSVLQSLQVALLVRDNKTGIFWKARARDSAVQDESRQIAGRVGLEELVSASVDNLSYGDVKKLELGLSFVQARHAWLLDEPTAGLDARESHDMADLILSMADNRALMMIEHDMDIVHKLSDRISVLFDGRLMATDSPDNIRDNDTVRRAWLGLAADLLPDIVCPSSPAIACQQEPFSRDKN